ncbi:MAG: ABC transporter permease [archaeon]
MKLLKIIWKNILLLTRSRTSAVIMLLSPLLIILLVGISFSTTSTYNLQIGVYSEKYSDLAESLIGKLDSDSYNIIRYNSQEECVSDIKFGRINTCIVFPSDLSITNEKASNIEFYIDQSKINIAYLIINTLSKSVSEKRSEISVELTKNIVDRLFETKKDIDLAKISVAELNKENDVLSADILYGKNKIKELDFTIPEGSNITELKTSVTRILESLNLSKTEAVRAANKGLDLLDSIESKYPSVNISDFESYKHDFEYINRTVLGKYESIENDTARLDSVISKLERNINELSLKLNTAGMANRDVLDKLTSMNNSVEKMKADMESLNALLDSAINRLNEIAITNPESIVSPIKTEIKPVVKEKTALNYMFPSIVILLIMFIGMLLPSLLIIIEKNSAASFRVFMTPTRNYVFILTNYITSFLVLFFQIAVILFISDYYFKIGISDNLTQIAIALFLIATMFIFAGMLIGYLFSSEETATIASVSIGSVLLFTSGTFFPIESMPAYIIDKIKFNPYLLSTEIFKKLLLFNTKLSEIVFSVKILLIFIFILLIAIVTTQKLSRLRLMQKKPKKIIAKEKLGQ